MNIQMPEMDAPKATAIIRQAERSSGHHQMIVALTAHAMKGDRERFLAAGMDSFISKPVRPEELLAVVEGWTLSAQARPTHEVFDLKRAVALARGRDELLQRL